MLDRLVAEAYSQGVPLLCFRIWKGKCVWNPVFLSQYCYDGFLGFNSYLNNSSLQNKKDVVQLCWIG